MESKLFSSQPEVATHAYTSGPMQEKSKTQKCMLTVTEILEKKNIYQGLSLGGEIAEEFTSFSLYFMYLYFFHGDSELC